MDGNGRWARARGKSRHEGHRAGVEAARSTLKAVREHGINTLTLFSFSTENWRRPPDEVQALLNLLDHFVAKDLKKLVEEGVRIHVIGQRDGLSDALKNTIERAESESAHCQRFNLVLAFNYGARDEITRAVRKLAKAACDGTLKAEEISDTDISGALDTSALPPLDLIIRTSGEHRLSNFLLWQAAYAELIFTDTLWPDFDAGELARAINEYASRERRYGGLSKTPEPS
jgi:undecaprenyl diphosphate synthase